VTPVASKWVADDYLRYYQLKATNGESISNYLYVTPSVSSVTKPVVAAFYYNTAGDIDDITPVTTTEDGTEAIYLKWPYDEAATGYRLYRKCPTDKSVVEAYTPFTTIGDTLVRAYLDFYDDCTYPANSDSTVTYMIEAYNAKTFLYSDTKTLKRVAPVVAGP
jgi:hypothetical protein